MTTGAKPLPEPTGDARIDRWRVRRARVREDLIEATLRAIEECGPDLSIDDVVRTAGLPRPKLYRFFADKEQLFAAVGERLQELIIERVVPRFRPTGTALELVRARRIRRPGRRGATSFGSWSVRTSVMAAPRPR